MAGRDEENKIYPCMALPTELHRVHTPDEDPAAQLQHGRRRWRGGWDRVVRPLRRRGKQLDVRR